MWLSRYVGEASVRNMPKVGGHKTLSIGPGVARKIFEITGRKVW